MIAKAVARSANEKIGDCATTYAAQVSCPDSCVFKDGGGCYAENGRIAAAMTIPLNRDAGSELATALDVARAEAVEIDRMQIVQGRPMRLHTVGDCSNTVHTIVGRPACTSSTASTAGELRPLPDPDPLIEQAAARVDAELVRERSLLLHDRQPVLVHHRVGQRAQDVGAGDVRILITKPSLVGYGLNFQHCRAMVFSGIDDSFERMYQAIRRAYRYGQTEPVHVHVPVIPELEGLMLDNLQRKQAQFDTDTAEQERWYRAALAESLSTSKEAA